MKGGGHLIELASWKRRLHFDLYRRIEQPFFSVTVEVDVTRLWRQCQDDPGASFFLAGLFALLRATNAGEPLRLRLRGEQVWLCDEVGTGTTILKPDETFAFARFDPAPTYDAFRAAGEATLRRVRSAADLADVQPDVDDVLYHSTLPWLRFTVFTNALGRDSIPRVVFGKVSAAGSEFRMPVAVEVHHALVDGLDVARFIDAFQVELNALDL